MNRKYLGWIVLLAFLHASHASARSNRAVVGRSMFYGAAVGAAVGGGVFLISNPRQSKSIWMGTVAGLGLGALAGWFQTMNRDPDRPGSGYAWEDGREEGEDPNAARTDERPIFTDARALDEFQAQLRPLAAAEYPVFRF